MTRITGALIGLYVAILSHGAVACEAVSEDMHIESATAAFTGTIRESKPVEKDADELLQFTVDKAYRGNLTGQATVVAPAHPCRYKKHEAGETWLIVGELGEDGKVTITWDSPSVKIRNADGTPTDKDIELLLAKLK
ncbi:MAG: hypothetical protein EPN97_12445 [Alphaproteobacteria bacterium]|nr:MAG: hypothetical protein EPN97_12445 [Alphaproteobacteria bacterium]